MQNYVLIFFLKALTDGNCFKSSVSAFQIEAPVNAKLFLNREVRAARIDGLMDEWIV